MTNQNTTSNSENDDEFFNSEEFMPVDFVERDNICEILASGETYTLNTVVDWVKENIERLNKILALDSASSSDVIKAYVWAYRHDNGNTKYISLDLHNEEQKKSYSFNFYIGGVHSFHLVEPTVPDCVEALHMIGLITTALKVNAVMGSHENEINGYCTSNLNLMKVKQEAI